VPRRVGLGNKTAYLGGKIDCVGLSVYFAMPQCSFRDAQTQVGLLLRRGCLLRRQLRGYFAAVRVATRRSPRRKRSEQLRSQRHILNRRQRRRRRCTSSVTSTRNSSTATFEADADRQNRTHRFRTRPRNVFGLGFCWTAHPLRIDAAIHNPTMISAERRSVSRYGAEVISASSMIRPLAYSIRNVVPRRPPT